MSQAGQDTYVNRRCPAFDSRPPPIQWQQQHHALISNTCATMAPMNSAVCFSLLAAPGLAFVRTPFVAEQVRHAPAPTARSTTSPRTATRMVATPDKVSTGVKRNENFAKLKVRKLMWLHRRCRGSVKVLHLACAPLDAEEGWCALCCI